MNRKQILAAAAIVLALGAAWTLGGVFGQSQPNVQVPKFQYDPSFPQPLPENWAIGAIGGMAVDSHDHIWVLHRPGPLQKNERLGGAAMTPPRAECCIPAPPVLEFDQDGKLLASWGGPGDGYRNRRVIVIDTETLAFKRMWGAYGNKPDDKNLGPYNPDAPLAQQFRLPHNVALSKDGLVYVADRPNDRIQVFKTDGTFVREAFIAPRTLLAGSTSGFALSPDQRFLYVIDGANHHVWILSRETLQVVDHIGQQGIFGGALNVPHALAVDSKGNIYVGENFDGRRFQRFAYKGMGEPTGKTLPPPKP